MNEYTVVNGNTAEVCEFDSHTTTIKYKIMQVKCKKTGKDITKNIIKMLENLDNRKRIKTVSNTVEFDKWFAELVIKNGTTNY
jgi:hypothetical protein